MNDLTDNNGMAGPALMGFLAGPEEHAHAPNTRRAYGRDVAYFWRWAELSAGRAEHYPIEKALLLDFVRQHTEGLGADLQAKLEAEGWRRQAGPYAAATLTRILDALSYPHRCQDLPDPCRDRYVRHLLRLLRRRECSQGGRLRKAAITSDVLERMVATCGHSAQGARDAALLRVGLFGGGRRRSELVALDATDLLPIEGGYLLRIARSKTDQQGDGRHVPLLGTTAEAVTAWLAHAQITTGALFRSVDKAGRIGGRLSDRSVHRVVTRRLREAGLDPSRYSAHSLRSGFITQAAQLGIPLPEAMAMSGHRAVEVAMRYYREGELLAGRAARLDSLPS